MPYHVGEKGSYGCKGYPAVKDDGTVMGCHETKEDAMAQIFAINQSEGNVDKQAPCWTGYVQRGMKPGSNGRPVPNCVPAKKAESMDKADTPEGYHRMPDGKLMADWIPHEGDMVMGITSEGPVVGRVEHVMLEGGVYGVPGTEYAIESDPENPAMAVRMYEHDDDVYYPTAYSIGMLASDATILTDLQIGTDEDIDKAEGYSAPAAAAAAARKAIKFKEDGKATGAGTAVGWTRARQLANGERLSLSTVKRMYSYFSRHEVDKKGKDWGNQSNPSKGYVMWLAWGGDAGFSWSRKIVNQNKDKALFSDFGMDFTRATKLTDLFE